MTYAYAQLSDRDLGVLRLSGPGLGNLLVPWARCLIAARRHSLTLVTPTWPQVKIGPLLRREPDKRLYIRVFAPGSDEVHGARKLRLLATAPRMPESALGEGETVRQGAVVVFRGLSSETLLGNDRLVAARLWSITRPAFRAQLPERQVPAIAVHVRLGDFRPRQPGDPPVANTRIGLDWYVEKLLGLRAAVGEETLAVVFSDGDDGELEPLLRLPRCRRGAYGAAISDLLAMSRYSALVASRSSFSMFGAYLGQVPTIWPRMTTLPMLQRDRRAEIESPAGQELRRDFLDEVRQRLDGAAAAQSPC